MINPAKECCAVSLRRPSVVTFQRCYRLHTWSEVLEKLDIIERLVSGRTNDIRTSIHPPPADEGGGWSGVFFFLSPLGSSFWMHARGRFCPFFVFFYPTSHSLLLWNSFADSPFGVLGCRAICSMEPLELPEINI
ncbi:hypothetical protein CDAR_214241 [Caerostris darwini]|uniref:Uncharacterized protein n=1 Tax=Caerostris darwini TaxID=1538125 RepID=A0AAV4S5T9_9ARAC|nr:hypothetical protein CDAR_214241 [Caerostris darwini]